ncbi:MAG: fibronectin type III-like domain-contianing protein [Candidatus Aminicenantales bacterium]
MDHLAFPGKQCPREHTKPGPGFRYGQYAFAFYAEKKSDWVAETGTFEIMVGSSSQDIRLSKK